MSSKSKWYLFGREEGISVANVNWEINPAEMRREAMRDNLGEVVTDILLNWQQMADTIYYDRSISGNQISKFESGFYDGFSYQINRLIGDVGGIGDVDIIRECENCGKNEAYEEDSEHRLICDACIEKHYITCSCCDKYCKDYLSTKSGGTVCRRCYNDQFFTCDECGEVFHDDEAKGDGGFKVCEACYVKR